MKMKRMAACLVVSGFAASSAMGGTVRFDLVVKDLNIHVYDVSIASTEFETFNSADLLIGSDKPLGLTFVYDQAFFDSAAPPPADPMGFGVYPADSFQGGFNASGWMAPLLIGQLTVDTGGSREANVIQVSNAYENELLGTGLSQVLSGVVPEPLEGMIKIPEPATLMLLGFGGLAVLRRRRA